MNIELHKVTWYSKLLAVILLLGGLPLLSFYIGSQYQKTKDIINSSAPSVTQNQAVSFSQDTCTDQNGKAIEPKTQSELSFCAEQSQSNAENQMQIVYNKITSQIDNNIENDPSSGGNLTTDKEFKQRFVDAQNLWVQYKNKQCEAESTQVEGGSTQPIIVSDCEALLTQRHTQILESLLIEMLSN